MPPICRLRLDPETRTDTKSPLFRGDSATRANKVRALETAWWAHQGSNLGPDD